MIFLVRLAVWRLLVEWDGWSTEEGWCMQPSKDFPLLCILVSSCTGAISIEFKQTMISHFSILFEGVIAKEGEHPNYDCLSLLRDG